MATDSCVFVQSNHLIENLLPDELEECIYRTFAADLYFKPVFLRKGALLECVFSNLRCAIVQSNLNDWDGDNLIEEFTIKVEVTAITNDSEMQFKKRLCNGGHDYQHFSSGSKLLFFTTIDLTKGWQGDELTHYLENFFRSFLPLSENRKVA